jgi:hypothetical protein
VRREPTKIGGDESPGFTVATNARAYTRLTISLIDDPGSVRWIATLYGPGDRAAVQPDPSEPAWAAAYRADRAIYETFSGRIVYAGEIHKHAGTRADAYLADALSGIAQREVVPGRFATNTIIRLVWQVLSDPYDDHAAFAEVFAKHFPDVWELWAPRVAPARTRRQNEVYYTFGDCP